MSDELPKLDFSKHDVIVISEGLRMFVSEEIPERIMLNDAHPYHAVARHIDNATDLLLFDIETKQIIGDISEDVAQAWLESFTDYEHFKKNEWMPEYVYRFEDLIEARRKEVGADKPDIWDMADVAYEEKRDRRMEDGE